MANLAGFFFWRVFWGIVSCQHRHTSRLVTDIKDLQKLSRQLERKAWDPTFGHRSDSKSSIFLGKVEFPRQNTGVKLASFGGNAQGCGPHTSRWDFGGDPGFPSAQYWPKARSDSSYFKTSQAQKKMEMPHCFLEILLAAFDRCDNAAFRVLRVSGVKWTSVMNDS